jgi:hypothetical protein
MCDAMYSGMCIYEYMASHRVRRNVQGHHIESITFCRCADVNGNNSTSTSIKLLYLFTVNSTAHRPSTNSTRKNQNTKASQLYHE